MQLLFADNTVLVNFALIQRLDLLESLLNGRGGWCHTVSSECARSSAVEGLSGLDEVGDFLGRPLVPTEVERVETARLREQMSQAGDPRSKNMGEAETLAILGSRPELKGALFITDDAGATRRARGAGGRDVIPVRCITTWYLLRMATLTRYAWALTADESWAYIARLSGQRRGVPREIRTREGWQAYLDGDGNFRDWPGGDGEERR